MEIKKEGKRNFGFFCFFYKLYNNRNHNIKISLWLGYSPGFFGLLKPRKGREDNMISAIPDFLRSARGERKRKGKK